MIKDALAGKIQLIITKSVSSFARNTVDCLATIRKLKASIPFSHFLGYDRGEDGNLVILAKKADGV